MPNPTRAPVRPPTPAPMAPPLSAAIIGPAAMNGPKPGMANAPIPASNPMVPPTTPPVLAPTVAPSGILVSFLCAKSRVLPLSGKSTEYHYRRSRHFLAFPPRHRPELLYQRDIMRNV